MFVIYIYAHDNWVVAGVFETWGLALETLIERFHLEDEDYDIEENEDRIRKQDRVYNFILHKELEINTVRVRGLEIWEKPLNVFNVYNF